jgi:dienelactone hydrolase
MWTRTSIACASVLLAGIVMPLACEAQAQRTEIHLLRANTLTDEQFLAGRREAGPATIAGQLTLPDSDAKKLPLVIMIHSSGGIWRYPDDLGQQLNAMGIATFLVDSFTSRGIVHTMGDQDQLGRLVMIADAYRALEAMSKHRRIDPQRIVLMGWSRGGQAALYASVKRFQRLQGPSDAAFAAYVAFYPNCNTRYRDDEITAAVPIRIFHGIADDYVPIAPCRAYVERLRKAGTDVVLSEYRDAHHVFDGPGDGKPVRIAGAQTIRNCALEESDAGQIVVSKTREPFTHKDPCVERGVTVGYNALAHAESYKATRDFLSLLFKLQ